MDSASARGKCNVSLAWYVPHIMPLTGMLRLAGTYNLACEMKVARQKELMPYEILLSIANF